MAPWFFGLVCFVLVWVCVWVLRNRPDQTRGPKLIYVWVFSGTRKVQEFKLIFQWIFNGFFRVTTLY
jgi:hypothetical protein